MYANNFTVMISFTRYIHGWRLIDNDIIYVVRGVYSLLYIFAS